MTVTRFVRLWSTAWLCFTLVFYFVLSSLSAASAEPYPTMYAYFRACLFDRWSPVASLVIVGISLVFSAFTVSSFRIWVPVFFRRRMFSEPMVTLGAAIRCAVCFLLSMPAFFVLATTPFGFNLTSSQPDRGEWLSGFALGFSVFALAGVVWPVVYCSQAFSGTGEVEVVQS